MLLRRILYVLYVCCCPYYKCVRKSKKKIVQSLSNQSVSSEMYFLFKKYVFVRKKKIEKCIKFPALVTIIIYNTSIMKYVKFLRNIVEVRILLAMNSYLLPNFVQNLIFFFLLNLILYPQGHSEILSGIGKNYIRDSFISKSIIWGTKHQWCV